MVKRKLKINMKYSVCSNQNHENSATLDIYFGKSMHFTKIFTKPQNYLGTPSLPVRYVQKLLESTPLVLEGLNVFSKFILSHFLSICTNFRKFLPPYKGRVKKICWGRRISDFRTYKSQTPPFESREESQIPLRKL